MTRVMSLVVAAIVCGGLPMAAQTNSECASQALDRARNVCDAAIDGARVFHPVAGLLVSGGNPMVGDAGSLGGFPHVSLSLRANATRVVVPDVNYNGIGRTVDADESLTAPAPLLEGALGVFRGMQGRYLAVDLLGSAMILPAEPVGNIAVADDAQRLGALAFGLGLGARLTLVNDLGPMPAVSVSVMRRNLPRIDVGDVSAGDRFAFGSDLAATNVRVTVGKALGPLTLAAGYGRDGYTGAAEIRYRDPITNAEQAPIMIDLDDTRSLGYLNVAFVLGNVRIAGELGMQGGKNLNLGTTFVDNDPAERRMFGGAALRIVF